MFQKELGFGTIDGLPHKEKGTIGEMLSGICLKSQLRQNPTLTANIEIHDPNPRVWISHINGPTVVQRLSFVDDSSIGGDSGEKIQWEPDFSFEMTLPAYNVRQRIFIETKTGDSRPGGSQPTAMRSAADQADPVSTTGLDQPTTPDERVVVLCQVEYNDTKANLSYERIEP